jgi:carbon-nitrogen hydrolase
VTARVAPSSLGGGTASACCAHPPAAWSRRAAEQGARLVVLPEMMLTGYPVEDLALHRSFADASIAALRATTERLTAAARGCDHQQTRLRLTPSAGCPVQPGRRRGS